MKLLYNRSVSPLAGFDIPSDQTLTLRYGINGWQRPVVSEMQRVTPPSDKTAKLPTTKASSSVVEDASDWWSADLAIPFEAAAVNFVINYQNHYDNNGGQDHKLNVSHSLATHKGPLRLNQNRQQANIYIFFPVYSTLFHL